MSKKYIPLIKTSFFYSCVFFFYENMPLFKKYFKKKLRLIINLKESLDKKYQ